MAVVVEEQRIRMPERPAPLEPNVTLPSADVISVEQWINRQTHRAEVMARRVLTCRPPQPVTRWRDYSENYRRYLTKGIIACQVRSLKDVNEIRSESAIAILTQAEYASALAIGSGIKHAYEYRAMLWGMMGIRL